MACIAQLSDADLEAAIAAAAPPMASEPQRAAREVRRAAGASHRAKGCGQAPGQQPPSSLELLRRYYSRLA